MKINKNRLSKIIIPFDATPTEHFAAKELQKYIQKIEGTFLSIFSDKDYSDDQGIIIGGPERNLFAKKFVEYENYQYPELGSEGFVIKSFDNALVLAGSFEDKQRGTLYAVYELLERYLGCSLAAFSHPDVNIGEYIEKKDEITLDDSIEYIKLSADRPFRGACVQYDNWAGVADHGLNIQFIDWLSKNRYNYLYLWTGVYEQLKKLGFVDEINKRGLDFVVGHHDSCDLFIPSEGNQYFPEKYYETHPEFFRLQEDGTRYKVVDENGQMIFCNRNTALIEEISKNIIKWLSFNQDVKYIQIAPHDGQAPQCVCDMCKPYTKTENYTYFLNEISKRVAKVYPDIKIILLVYVDLWECPKDIELEPSLVVMEAPWFRSENGLRTCGKPDGTSLNGTHFEENLFKWKDAGAKIMYYDYYMCIYAARQRWTPIADEIQAIWKRFKEKDVLGASTQIECFNMWNHIFNFYTFGRTGYDLELSIEDNLNRFVRIFGDGGSWVAKAILEGEKVLDGQVGMEYAPAFLMKHIDKEFVYNCYEKAFDEAKAPLERNNLRMMRMVFRYSDLELQEKDAESFEYTKVRKYPNINKELLYMTKFDSYWKNHTGYGISIPLDSDEAVEEFIPDKWYRFE